MGKRSGDEVILTNVSHELRAEASLETVQARELPAGRRVSFLADAPEVVHDAIAVLGAFNRFPLLQVIRHEVALFVAAGAVKIPCLTAHRENNDAGECLPLMLGEKQVAQSTLDEKLMEPVEVLPGPHYESIALCSLKEQVIEAVHVRDAARLSNLHALAFRKAYIVAPFALEAGENIVQIGGDIQAHDTAGLNSAESISCGGGNEAVSAQKSGNAGCAVGHSRIYRNRNMPPLSGQRCNGCQGVVHDLLFGPINGRPARAVSDAPPQEGYLSLEDAGGVMMSLMFEQDPQNIPTRPPLKLAPLIALENVGAWRIRDKPVPCIRSYFVEYLECQAHRSRVTCAS